MGVDQPSSLKPTRRAILDNCRTICVAMAALFLLSAFEPGCKIKVTPEQAMEISRNYLLKLSIEDIERKGIKLGGGYDAFSTAARVLRETKIDTPEFHKRIRDIPPRAFVYDPRRSNCIPPLDQSSLFPSITVGGYETALVFYNTKEAHEAPGTPLSVTQIRIAVAVSDCGIPWMNGGDAIETVVARKATPCE